MRGVAQKFNRCRQSLLFGKIALRAVEQSVNVSGYPQETNGHDSEEGEEAQLRNSEQLSSESEPGQDVMQESSLRNPKRLKAIGGTPGLGEKRPQLIADRFAQLSFQRKHQPATGGMENAAPSKASDTATRGNLLRPHARSRRLSNNR